MPTSPVNTRIPLTSFGHLVTEVKLRLKGDLSLKSIHDVCNLAGITSSTIPPDDKVNSYPTSLRQLFGIEAPASVELTGWRKYFNSYTLQGRRNCVLATYGILAVTAAAYWMHKQSKKDDQTSSTTA